MKQTGMMIGDYDLIEANEAFASQALADGADLLVIGRQITGAADPGAAAKANGAPPPRHTSGSRASAGGTQRRTEGSAGQAGCG